MLIIDKKGNKYPLYINYVSSIMLGIFHLFIFKTSKQFYKKLTKLLLLQWK